MTRSEFGATRALCSMAGGNVEGSGAAAVLADAGGSGAGPGSVVMGGWLGGTEAVAADSGSGGRSVLVVFEAGSGVPTNVEAGADAGARETGLVSIAGVGACVL
jgi:hypothetical protein